MLWAGIVVRGASVVMGMLLGASARHEATLESKNPRIPEFQNPRMLIRILKSQNPEKYFPSTQTWSRG